MRQRGQKFIVKCEICGKEVERYPSTKKPHVYCSKECVGKSKRNGSKVKCQQCGTKFYRRYGEQDLDIRENQFCSINCYQAYRAENIKPTTYKKNHARHEHRIVAEKALGRKLKPKEVVHHIDGNKHNNHVSNLAVLPNQSIHAKIHRGTVSESAWTQYRLAKG